MIKWTETRSLKHRTLRIISAHKLPTDVRKMKKTDYMLPHYIQVDTRVVYSSK